MFQLKRNSNQMEFPDPLPSPLPSLSYTLESDSIQEYSCTAVNRPHKRWEGAPHSTVSNHQPAEEELEGQNTGEGGLLK